MCRVLSAFSVTRHNRRQTTHLLFGNPRRTSPATRFEGNTPMSTGADLSRGFSLGAAFPPLPVCRFTVEQYEAMIRAGITTEDDTIELLDGMSPLG
jgi:hypothetical protein